MIEASQFGQSARSFVKNPLGIIALFIVLMYGFAALVVGASSQLQASERYPIVCFLVLFPVLVLIIFVWLVSKHHQKLYAPLDFKSDEAFLESVDITRENTRPALTELYTKINAMVDKVMTSERLVSGIQDENELKERVLVAAEEIKSQISQSSFIRIKASGFVKSKEDTFEFPIDAFATFSDLLHHVYALISRHVRPFEYGHTWVLKDQTTKRVFRSLGMLSNTPRGFRVKDPRTLDEFGIHAGMTLLVSKPEVEHAHEL